MNQFISPEIKSVAFLADSPTGLASYNRMNFYFFNFFFIDFFTFFFGNHLAFFGNHFFCLGVNSVFEKNPSGNSGRKTDTGDNRVFPIYPAALFIGAIRLANHHILGHIYEAPGEISSRCCPKSRIGHTLSGAVRGDKIFQNAEPFLERGFDGKLDCFSGRSGNEALHPRHLNHYRFRPASF